jgi:hypothetical protein
MTTLHWRGRKSYETEVGPRLGVVECMETAGALQRRAIFLFVRSYTYSVVDA